MSWLIIFARVCVKAIGFVAHKPLTYTSNTVSWDCKWQVWCWMLRRPAFCWRCGICRRWLRNGYRDCRCCPWRSCSQWVRLCSGNASQRRVWSTRAWARWRAWPFYHATLPLCSAACQIDCFGLVFREMRMPFLRSELMTRDSIAVGPGPPQSVRARRISTVLNLYCFDLACFESLLFWSCMLLAHLCPVVWSLLFWISTVLNLYCFESLLFWSCMLLAHLCPVVWSSMVLALCNYYYMDRHG